MLVGVRGGTLFTFMDHVVLVRDPQITRYLYLLLTLLGILCQEKAMAPHSSTLAWKIPWTGEPGRLQSMG